VVLNLAAKYCIHPCPAFVLPKVNFLVELLLSVACLGMLKGIQRNMSDSAIALVFITNHAGSIFWFHAGFCPVLGTLLESRS
jgi:hypothetical protein